MRLSCAIWSPPPSSCRYLTIALGGDHALFHQLKLGQARGHGLGRASMAAERGERQFLRKASQVEGRCRTSEQYSAAPACPSSRIYFRICRQTSTHKVNMASQCIQIARIDSRQLQMVRPLINLIQFRIQSVGVELWSLCLHIVLDRPDLVVEPPDLQLHRPVVHLRQQLEHGV